MALTEKQQRILDFVQRFTRDNRYPPTIREIGAEVGISSTSVVNYNLNALQKEGYINRDRTISRGIKLVGQQPEIRGNLVRIPIVGRIAAGLPVPVPDSDFDPEGGDAISLAGDIVKDEPGIYALRVRGNSMIDALINDGDIVVLKYQQEAHNGDMVAVWLRDEKETTLKRFYLEGERVRLQPANPTMEPIFVHPGNVEIQGKVIAVIRQVSA